MLFSEEKYGFFIVGRLNKVMRLMDYLFVVARRTIIGMGLGLARVNRALKGVLLSVKEGRHRIRKMGSIILGERNIVGTEIEDWWPDGGSAGRGAG